MSRSELTDSGAEAHTDAVGAVDGGERTFRRLLVNTLVSGVTSTFLWFALTFWVYLETRSVVATAVVGATFSLTSAFIAPAFGSFVDRHRKHAAMMLATSTSTVCFAGATLLYAASDTHDLLRLRSPLFWMLVALTLVGSVASMVRSIALSTCVTLLVPEGRRDRANGLVGTVTGLSMAITSVFSGIVIGRFGMGSAFLIALALTVGALVHLSTVRIEEAAPEMHDGSRSRIEVRVAVEAIRAVPGLFMLILLAAFNNLLAGVFMALMDAYGLSLVSVETWGLLWGFISLALIAGGLVVARTGLGPTPVKVVLLGNLVNWVICALFPLRSSIVLLTIGMCVWLALMPVIEAAEQTVLQQAIPFDRQGRVFGFAQMIENAAAPITAICMGPLAENVFMPTMSDGRGADWIGGWFGTGPDRGLAIMFTLAGLFGVVVTAVARASRSYRRLAAA